MSSALDEDTARAINDGRAVLGSVLRSAQLQLQKVFIVFVIGLVGTIWVARRYLWAQLRADLLARTSEATIIVTTPFDVILLQVKMGLVVGILLALPMIVYYSRDALKERGYWPFDRVARWKLAVIGLLGTALFVGGVSYGYFVFFPFVFEFLAGNAAGSGFSPNYSIVMWAQFVFLLTVSFGLAAQLPLVMSGLSLANIVPYETFRDKWRHAVVAIFIFGAVFSPPDPFTQIMWAVPLLFLYAFSLGLAKFVVTLQRSGEQIGYGRILRSNWNTVLGAAFVLGAAVYVVFSADIGPTLTQLFGYIPAEFRPGVPVPGSTLGVDRATGVLVWTVGGALVGGLAAFVYHLFQAVDRLAKLTGVTASAGDPADLDLGPLDAGAIRAAPPEVFAKMTEEVALRHASEALEMGDDEKAQAILDRYDEAQEAVKEAAASGEPTEEPEEEGSIFTRTTAGMFSAFTEEEVEEEEIGGYIYDIQFIVSSLTSKSFYLVGVFMLVMGVTFTALYLGFIRVLKETFLSQLPAQVVDPNAVSIVALHPVEVLIFEVKMSVIAGAIALVPLLLYWAWPAFQERGLIRADRNALYGTAGAILLSILVGTLVGFLVIGPYVISALAWDAIRAQMIVDYRINNFGWLVFFTTVGVGLLFAVPTGMLMLHRNGLVPFRTMWDRWRVVVVGALVAGMVLSPRGVFTMFLLALPFIFMYGVGLALLYLYTLGGRRGGGRSREQTAD